MEEIRPTTWDVKNSVNNEMIYQPQPVSPILLQPGPSKKDAFSSSILAGKTILHYATNMKSAFKFWRLPYYAFLNYPLLFEVSNWRLLYEGQNKLTNIEKT